MVNLKRELNPVAMSIINFLKEIGNTRDPTCRPRRQALYLTDRAKMAHLCDFQNNFSCQMATTCLLMDLKISFQTMFSNALFLTVINPFPNKPWFLRGCSTSLLKTEKEEEIACNKQFLLLPQCFLLILRTFLPFS